MRFPTYALAAGFILSGANAFAANISLVGVVRDRALMTVDGGEPTAYAIGSTIAPGHQLLAVHNDGATITEHGKSVTIAMGRYPAQNGANQSLVLRADSAGQFYTNGSINGMNARMLVDTGATHIAMPATDATRFGIDYRKGQPGTASTANGIANVFRVHIERMRIGEVELRNLEAIVQESGLPIILLGSNFLDQFSMRRERQEMILTPR
ncbi:MULTISPECIES: TIGR02281 family clan AA aspartic protease [unclassified Duganella]|uniref:retropepsin-like aspartic protease family protein n=1 Tax=unclassified Duganella TaxID=2636909 RepID=UPI000E344475|nr:MULTISPECIES: TIGR02281 family clan AA aspartic protease [unclassified Duganella]RFP08190.1 TIGR02281 family clan AA aspartic protease [Duganella sp. BJB475]RFP22488.1 TIGR02281 family clan AA aspartic protease [Duganella sp. BJB476]